MISLFLGTGGVARPPGVGYAPPTAAGNLADLTLPLNSGVHTVNASSDFTGEGLTFRVAGEGVGIDPATGTLTITTDQLRDGIEIAVTATNSGGAATSRFRLTVAALPLDAAPVLIAAPALVGTGAIGSPVTLEPGSWGGVPAPALAFQWRRDGADIAGATDAEYVPGPAEDGRILTCRVTATNSSGSLAAETPALAVVWPTPVVTGVLADVAYALGSGPQTIEAAAAFAGDALVYAVSGAGASIAPDTGRVTLSTDALRAGETVSVTASNSGGSATVAFRVTVQSTDAAPAVLTLPSLAGSGRIGDPVTLDPGAWSGMPAPALAFQWRRDGADIAGATGPVYTPVAADDLADLTCRVAASNAAGAAEAETPALAVVWPAPVATGALPDLELVQGSGPQTIPAGAAFTGASLTFAVTGGGATVAPATGVLTLPTDTLRAGETVTVTATNSGGAASAGFRLDVVAAVLPPEAVGTLPGVAYLQGTGVQTVSAQAGFAGAELAYALDTAPAGVTIDAASGLVSIATDAALAATTVTVRAHNAAGSALQSFGLEVRAAPASVFDRAAALGDLGFVTGFEPKSWDFMPGGFAQFAGRNAYRVHGAWALAAGDGLYRCLARWNAPDQSVNSPFLFGARIRAEGSNTVGFFFQAFQTTSNRQLRLRQYTGTGSTHTLSETVSPGWEWNSWYWLDLEIDGASVKARLYPEAAASPGWQLASTVTVTGSGAVGPGTLPNGGIGATVDIRRLEYLPLPGQGPVLPPAPADTDWTLSQIAEGA